MSNEGIFERVFSNAKAKPVVEEEPTVIVETTQGDDDGIPAASEQEEAKPKLASVLPTNLFRNHDTHPLLLDLVLLRKYGADWLGWELETLTTRIVDDFKTPTVSDVNVEKIQACKTLHLVDDFWLRWEVFLPCCAAFNGSFADFSNMQAPDVAECMVAVDIANRLRNDTQWSTEIKAFLSVVHRHQGALCPVPPLDFVTVDTTGLPVDVEDVRRRWPLVRSSGRAPSGGTIEDEQLRKMLGSWAYLELARKRLSAQLPILQHV